MMRHGLYYKLIGKLVVPTDMHGAMFAHRVAETTVGELWVSTVFLGIDHSLGGWETTEAPVVFETMIFTSHPEMDWAGEYQTRCCTYDEAERMHAEAVATAKAWVRKAARMANLRSTC